MPRNRMIRRRRRVARQNKSKGSALKGFTKQQTITLKRAIGLNDETKYYAKTVALNQAIDPAIHSPSIDSYPLVPAIPKSLDENGRSGRKVVPTKCRVDVSIGFNQPNPGAEVPAWTQYAQQIYVVIYLLRSKTYKNWNQWQQSTQWMELLDYGDGTSGPFGNLNSPAGGTPFWTASTADMMKPVESSGYTLLRKKIVKLTKNGGNVDTGTAASFPNPNLHQTSYHGSFNYRLPTLQYDDTEGAASGSYAGFPTNANVLMAVGWCYADNNGTYYLGPSSTPSAPDSIVSVTARTHVWYKDS